MCKGVLRVMQVANRTKIYPLARALVSNTEYPAPAGQAACLEKHSGRDFRICFLSMESMAMLHMKPVELDP